MKIFAAGIATETNTFSPIPTALEDFIVQRGRDVAMGRVEFPSLDLCRTWGQQARVRGDEFVFSLNAWADPSGITVKGAYERLREEVLEDLRAAMPVDIVLLNLHGAMVAQDYESCEEDMIRRVREVTGKDVVIGVVLDLHCHLNETTIAAADIVITYKEYPHVDIHDRARELFDLAVQAKLGKVRPTMALFDCAMVGLYPTTRQPLQAFVAAMVQAERRSGVLSVSFAHGFPFADLPHVGAKMLVVTDNNQSLAQKVAREFGLQVYRARHDIGFDSMSLPMEEALSRALASRRTPVVVADQSDNPGAGAPGDATFALRWLLDHRVEAAALGIFYDPEVVQLARKAGEGARLTVRLGGKLGPSSGDPVDIEVTVLALCDHYTNALPQQSGATALPTVASVAALRCGDIDIVVSNRRCQCFSPSIFSDLGIDLKRKKIVIPKSTQHFRAAFGRVAGEIIYMSAPGAVAPDPMRLPYRRLDTTTKYPWNRDPLSRSVQSCAV